ncbi:glutamate racemase [Endozoicomonas montiporae]|uniref:Glutamate racemase n=1 Tax=Endozoicomonas montiporae TaxID=1027273 RepID=A0A081N0E2_9GAMM|nr:glutamate racemase [Endozoicomonas montiporae]
MKSSSMKGHSIKSRPIVIFDSGVGGLSIYQEVKRKLPDIEVIYCADNEAFPYGSKPETEVIDRTLYCLNELARQFQPSLAIIACNTASTISLPKARQALQIPVVGVVPAIKPAGEWSKKRRIGLLATPGTIAREYTQQLVRDFAKDCEVIMVGSSELVDMAERHLRDEPVGHEEFKAVIEPFFVNGQQPDCIVLGCTHFPLLEEQLQAASPVPIHWINSGEAIARRVEYLLERAPESGTANSDQFIYTGNDDGVQALMPALKSMGFETVSQLEQEH